MFESLLIVRSRFGVLCAALWVALLAQSCSAPSLDGSTAAGKQGVFDRVYQAINYGDCATAVTAIEPLLNSSSTDNTVRMKAASAYACNARVNFFPLINNLVANSATLIGPGFWSKMAEFFPSTAGSDYVMEGAILGLDVLKAVLVPGALVLPANQTNAGTYNPGSVFISDRTSDSNMYMIFVAMSAIGGIQSRYGSPNPVTFVKTVDLPWTTAATVDDDGCAYASSIIYFIDALGDSASLVSPSLSPTLTSISVTFQAAINAACDAGCQGSTPGVGVPPILRAGAWTPSGCALAACASCPTALRDRTRCTGLATDENSCAAAGIVNFINSSAIGWN